MKKQVLTRFGGPDAFRLVEESGLVPHPGQIRVAVKASGVNFADVMMRMGLYPEAPKLPFVPGYEFAGTVADVGEGVTNFKAGDRVFGACRFGGYVSEILAEPSQLRKTPEHLSDVEAAAIPVNFMTAWVALEAMARVRKGDRVLIHSAAGGVGLAAVQIASGAGAEVTGIIGSEEKGKILRENGASRFLIRSEWERLSDSEAPRFDAILDPNGGASLKRSLARLAPGGRVVAYGAGSMVSGEKRSLLTVASAFLKTPIFTPFKFMMTNTGLYGLNLLKLFEAMETGKSTLMERAFDDTVAGVAQKKLKPVVGKTFKLEDVGDAHLYLQSRGSVGKVVLLT